jgi:uncharacterized iron-regulated membrane protein
MPGRGGRLRRAVRRVHLWLGLGLGGLFALLGLTGSVLVFYPEIDGVLHPALRAEAAAAPAPPPDWDRALATLRRAFPDKDGPWRLEATGRPGPIPARYYNPPERAGHDFRPMMVWLSADGARVIRRDYWGEYAMTFVYDLHFRLLLGEAGGKALGWAGFGLLALLLSGLWAWWPRGSWAKALRVKPRAAPSRALRDWHKLTGLAGLGLLILLTGTGIMLELPEESDAALGAMGLPVAAMAAPHGGHGARPGHGGQVRFGPSHAAEAALVALPGARLAWIETPPATGGAYRLRLQVPGDPSFRFPHSFAWVDAANGRVSALHDIRRAPAGDRINAWVHPLHDGSAMGLPGRILVALCGLLPAILFVTGWRRWRLGRHAGQPRGRAARTT